jgi:hypothetical protein
VISLKDEIKEISKADKKLLDKIEYILGSELSSKEYDVFYNYFNEIRKPNILIDIKDDENIKDYITNLQEENERLKNRNEFLEKVCVGFDDKYENYKLRNEKAKSLTNRTIEIIKQQPSGNDEWILERLNGINYCLGGDEE